MSMHELFGEPIYSYTRAHAIDDGELVDVTEWASADKGFRGGFRFPVALTRAAWARCVEWTDADNARTGACNDERGRAHDVLWMASLAARRGGTRVAFSVLRIPREGCGQKATRADLVAVCGPDDDGSPCVTIMLPDED